MSRSSSCEVENETFPIAFVAGSITTIVLHWMVVHGRKYTENGVSYSSLEPLLEACSMKKFLRGPRALTALRPRDRIGIRGPLSTE